MRRLIAFQNHMATIFWYVVSACRNEHNVQLLMTAAMGVHTLEALLTAWICWGAGLSHEHTM
jgi:hypothetical protein